VNIPIIILSPSPPVFSPVVSSNKGPKGNRGGAVRGRGGRGGNVRGGFRAGGFKVSITNLHFNVTEQDLKSYFSQEGELKKVIVHYDNEDRPAGAADLVFAARDVAVRVASKYNNSKINGKQISTKFLE